MICSMSDRVEVGSCAVTLKATGLVLVLLMVGCSSNGPERSTTIGADPELDVAVRDYMEATFFMGDGEAGYAMLSDRCKGDLTADEFSTMTEMVEKNYIQSLKEYKIKQTGKTATVTFTFLDPAIDQTQEQWRQENGSWRNDYC